MRSFWTFIVYLLQLEGLHSRGIRKKSINQIQPARSKGQIWGARAGGWNSSPPGLSLKVGAEGGATQGYFLKGSVVCSWCYLAKTEKESIKKKMFKHRFPQFKGFLDRINKEERFPERQRLKSFFVPKRSYGFFPALPSSLQTVNKSFFPGL